MRPIRHTLLRLVPMALFYCALAVGTIPSVLHAQDAPGAGGGRPGGGGQRGGFANMPRVQGEVTAISGANLMVKAEDGSISTIATTDNTRLMHSQGLPTGASAAGGRASGEGPGGGQGARGGGMGNMQPIKMSDIHVGDGVMAMGQMEPGTKTLHAMFAVVTDASVVKALKDNLGKTYITGKVTAVDLDDAKLTLMRPDGVSQTIGLDESTSFHRVGGRRGGDAAPAAAGTESITLADVKVGDSVAGQGSLKGGTFVPKELTVMGQRPPHGAEGGPGAGAPAAPPAQP